MVWFGIHCLKFIELAQSYCGECGAGNLVPRQGLWKAFWLTGAAGLSAWDKACLLCASDVQK